MQGFELTITDANYTNRGLPRFVITGHRDHSISTLRKNKSF